MNFVGIILGAVFGYLGFLLVGTCIQAYSNNKWGAFLWRGCLGTLMFIGGLYSLINSIGFSEKVTGIIIAIVSAITAVALFSVAREKYKQKSKTQGAMLTVAILCLAFMCFSAIVGTQANDSSSDEPARNYNIVGQKLSRIHVKNHNDMYYTDRDDSKLRYFTNDDNKITAAKYVFGADHYPTTSVQNKLENVIIQDSKLKYTDDKQSRDDFSPDGDSFNIYSPKRKKWYHVSMQRDSDDKVSQFSVWPGKSDDVDDF